MCEICMMMPCHSRCPNASEPVPAAYCRKCHDPLFVGDRHFDGICEACLDEMETSGWLELFGEYLKEIKE